MQKYVLIQLLEPIAEGTEFSMSDWPLHVTLVSNFAVDWETTHLFKKLSDTIAEHTTFQATAGEDAHFGPTQQTHVTLLEMNDPLRRLHADIMTTLKSTHAIFDEPRYLEDGFRAHATIQKTGRLQKGDAVTFNAVTIVDMFPGGDIRRRKILKTIPLA